MEHPAVASETSSYSVSASEEADRSPADANQGSGDASVKTKRKRGAAIKAAGWKEEQSLIDVIKHNGRVINHAVKKWVERYEADSKSAMAEILILLFEACGAKYQFEMDSFEDTDVDNVMRSLEELAKNGEVENYFNSKKKDLKSFKENLASLWDHLVLECQNGQLFDQILFEKCMTYLKALLSTSPRVYRQVASLVGLRLGTSFIGVAKVLSGQRETTQRQLNAEKKKQHDGPHLESLNKRLSFTHEKIIIVEEMLRTLFTKVFENGYRDVDPEIRMSHIKSLGIWILSYPSVFLQNSYLKYLGWALNDKSAGVRKASLLALQNLYEVNGNVPSLGLFTKRFRNRMIELADDVDISVAVSAIGLLQQLLRHQLISVEELGPLHDLLIDETPQFRRAIGKLVFDHLIVQNSKNSHSRQKDGEDGSSEVHLGNMLRFLREFPDDPILSAYVIDDVWDDMKAMKDWKCIISILLDENPHIELNGVDATNLVRLFYASARKAVGVKLVPSTDNRKQYYTKAQREAWETSRKEITTAMMKSYPQLLHKYIADKAKVSPLVEIVGLLQLELYSVKRQEQNFKRIVDLIVDAFYKHGEKITLRSCVKVLTFCSTNSQADLQDYAHSKLKDLENDLIIKLKVAIKEVEMGGDEYSLLVNLKRLYELQLTKSVSVNGLYEDMASILRDLSDTDNEVKCFLLRNMYAHVAWCLRSIDGESREASVAALLSKRDTLLSQLDCLLKTLLEFPLKERRENVLSFVVCVILAEMWYLFKKSKYSSSRLESLGYRPDIPSIKKFWKLSKSLLTISDETEEEYANAEYTEERNKEVVMVAASKLVVTDTVSMDYLAPEIISQFVMHGTGIAEIVKHLITSLRKTGSVQIPTIFLKALRRTYWRCTVDDQSLESKPYSECKDLASRLSATFIGTARTKHKSEILSIVKDGVAYAFTDAPKNLKFLEVAVLPFIPKLPTSDILEIRNDVRKRSENVDMNEDPSGWRPYSVFVDFLEKRAKNELQDTNR